MISHTASFTKPTFDRVSLSVKYFSYTICHHGIGVRLSIPLFFKDKTKSAEIYACKSWGSLVLSSIAQNGVGDLRSIQTTTLLTIFDLTSLLSAPFPSFTRA